MRAGKLDRRIVIESFTTSQNGYGELIKSWSTLATVWAEVNPKSGREFFASNQRIAEFETVFRIRYRSDITINEKYRISYGGKYYDIKHIAEVGRREGLDLLAQVEAA